jgi:hypothetical protein
MYKVRTEGGREERRGWRRDRKQGRSMVEEGRRKGAGKGRGTNGRKRKEGA